MYGALDMKMIGNKKFNFYPSATTFIVIITLHTLFAKVIKFELLNAI
jgi:hypothetical protein